MYHQTPVNRMSVCVCVFNVFVIICTCIKLLFVSLYSVYLCLNDTALTECLCVCVINVFVIICTCIKLLFVSLYSVYLCLNDTALINETTKTNGFSDSSTHVTDVIVQFYIEPSICYQ